MRFLGIDFGEKRVGVAISDADNSFAIAKGVLKNDQELIPSLKKMCEENEIMGLVLGESKDYHGAPNAIMKKVLGFKEVAERELKIPVYMEPEYMTSAEAVHLQGESAMIDASAAALILKSYLDKNKNI